MRLSNFLRIKHDQNPNQIGTTENTFTRFKIEMASHESIHLWEWNSNQLQLFPPVLRSVGVHSNACKRDNPIGMSTEQNSIKYTVDLSINLLQASRGTGSIRVVGARHRTSSDFHSTGYLSRSFQKSRDQRSELTEFSIERSKQSDLPEMAWGCCRIGSPRCSNPVPQSHSNNWNLNEWLKCERWNSDWWIARIAKLHHQLNWNRNIQGNLLW